MGGKMISVLLGVKTKKMTEECQKTDFLKSASIETIKTADEGKAAWELFLKYRPELVVLETDLSGLDGFTLAKKIRKEAPKTTLIFLGEKSYKKVQEALNLHAEGYYIKEDLSMGEWKEILKKTVKKLDLEKFLETCMIQCQLSNYFMGRYELDQEILEEIFPKRMDFMVLEEDHMPSGFEDVVPKRKEKASATQVMEVIKKDADISYLVYLPPYRYLCFCEGSVDFNEKAYKIKEKLQEEVGKSFSAFLLCRMSKIQKCHESYKQMEWLFEQRYFEGEGVVMDSMFYEKPKAENKDISLENLQTSMERGCLDTCLKELSDLFLPVLKNSDYDMFEKLVKEIMALLLKYDNKALDIQNKKVFTLHDGDDQEFLTAKETIRWIRNKCRELLSYKKEEMGCSTYINRAVRQIIVEYKKPDLSVEDIAQSIGIRVNRMNEMFKEELGETAGYFLTKVRMEKARQLLEDGVRVGEVSNQIGYYSPSYFSKVFKKTYSLSPKEYQKQIEEEKFSAKN